MQVAAYDPARVILLSLHVGEPPTDAEVDGVVERLRRATVDAALQGGVVVTNLVLIESQHGVTAIQRRRMGEAMALVPRARTAFVVRSALVRGMITAVGWLHMSNARGDRIQSTHATYEGARQWLVEKSGHPAAIFDAMERKTRLTVLERERRAPSVAQ
jgi:hypothetical protein